MGRKAICGLPSRQKGRIRSGERGFRHSGSIGQSFGRWREVGGRESRYRRGAGWEISAAEFSFSPVDQMRTGHGGVFRGTPSQAQAI